MTFAHLAYLYIGPSSPRLESFDHRFYTKACARKWYLRTESTISTDINSPLLRVMVTEGRMSSKPCSFPAGKWIARSPTNKPWAVDFELVLEIIVHHCIPADMFNTSLVTSSHRDCKSLGCSPCSFLRIVLLAESEYANSSPEKCKTSESFRMIWPVVPAVHVHAYGSMSFSMLI